MSWLDYILPKASNESRVTGEPSERPKTSGEFKEDIKDSQAGVEYSQTTPEDYVSSYISSVGKAEATGRAGLDHAFDDDAQKIKDLYHKNPIKVIIEPDDEPFRMTKKEEASLKIEELSKPTDPGTEKKFLSQDEALALVKNPDFVMGYKYREHKIKSMAQENCADIEGTFKECLKGGSLFQRMNLCYNEHLVLSDCLASQKVNVFKAFSCIAFQFP